MRKNKFLGKMPDPFLKPDGTRVTPAEWPEYKKGLGLYGLHGCF